MGVKHNIGNGVRAFEALDGKIKKAMEDAAEDAGDKFIRDSIQTMRQNDSVETSTGIRSFRNRDMGGGERGVFAASYLEALDRGISKGHRPDISSPRFQIWARSNGFTPAGLGNVIKAQGTKPHPWYTQSVKRTRTRIPGLINLQVEKAFEKTERMIK